MRIRWRASLTAGAAVVALAGPVVLATPAVAADVRLTQITSRSGSAFPLTPDFSLTSYADALVGALGADSVGAVLDSANRPISSCNTSQTQAQPQYYARTDIPLDPSQIISSSDRFCWNPGDSAVTYWLPQGVTGSSDADDDHLWGTDKVMVVSWHYSATEAGTSYDKGVRISMIDRNTGMYRHVLLVEPTKTSTPNFKAIGIHAGGLAWLGNYLYVADTGTGIRVFDMRNFLRISGSSETSVGLQNGVYQAYGYAYALPQIGVYRQATTNPSSPCAPTTSSLCFSSLSLDRSTTPDTLVVGEYRNGVDTANLDVVGGRVVRYDVDSTTRQLVLTSGKAVPRDAVTIPKSNVQGVQTWNGTYYLGRSSAEKHSFMYSGPKDVPMSTWSWAIGGEDLYHEHSGTGSAITAGKIWTVTEHYLNPDGSGSVIDRRVVFAVPLSEMS